MLSYKKSLIANLEKHELKKQSQLAKVFDSEKSTQQKIKALKKIGSINEDGAANQALDIVSDAKASATLRALALEKISSYFGRNESFLHKITYILTDQNNPSKLRLAALKCIQKNTFSSPVFLAQRPAYIAALRALIDDDDPEIRETAIENLALNGDEYVQRRLIEGLENPKKKITKPELAVQYLAYDLHADHFPLLRKLASDPPNKKTRMEALRNLAADSDAKDLLESTFVDRKEDPEVRHLCGVALQRLDPNEFEKTANNILAAKNENEELKAALVNTKLHLPGADMPKLAEDIRELSNHASDNEGKARADHLSNFMSMRKQG